MGAEINVGLISLIISISSFNRDVEEGRKGMRMRMIVANASYSSFLCDVFMIIIIYDKILPLSYLKLLMLILFSESQMYGP